MTRRLVTFLATSFAITWGAWGVLILLARTRTAAYGEWPFMALYILGGLGPTIGAYVAVLATSTLAPLSEFHRRLLRWRVSGSWYLIAVGLPIGLAIVSTVIARWLSPDLSGAISFQPWYILPLLFLMMILGGGLEELGWRGVAQPEMGRTVGHARAALSVGFIWAIWHAPLFLIPGVSQYGTSFLFFAIGVIGTALILGWLYSRTESILLCVIFHAAGNAIAIFGFVISREAGWLALVAPCLNVLVGSVLLSRIQHKPAIAVRSCS